MKATIEVKDRRESEAIRTGLDDPAVRAFVVIVGTLSPLTKRHQSRVLQYVKDALEEQAETGVVHEFAQAGRS